MKKRPLRVALEVREPSIVEVTVGDRVQLDRLTESPRGSIPERHGELLEPGVTTVALARGRYCFRTLSDAKLHVVCGGVEAQAINDPKDPWPPPGLASVKGDEPAGESPALTVE